ncbi:MAG: potassium channel family protein [Burkholderiales bacterium]|nr:potassium channel family protein [Opitutaceae bacterium]
MRKPASLHELGPFQLVIVTLSLFVLVLIGAEMLFDLPDESSRVLGWIDNVACGLFFVDFVVRFRRAESKLQFMKWGWIDLLASIPVIEALRWGRVFRLIRIIRLLRAAKSIRLLFEIFFRNRTEGGVASVFIITFLVISLSTAGILLVEKDPASNIHTAEDAIWWTVTTVTTVGYGDCYPVTPAGRLIACALMITGVGLFGTLSGVIASLFLGDRKPAAHTDSAEILARLDALQQEVARLRRDPPGPN